MAAGHISRRRSLISHNYTKLGNAYILKVSVNREYRIYKVHSRKWEWAEWTNFWGLSSKASVNYCKRFRDCVLAIEFDNQFKERSS